MPNIPKENNCGFLDMPLLVKNRWNKILMTQARQLADLHLPLTASAPPHRGFRSAYPPAQNESLYPAACINDYGCGQAAYIATTLSSTYWCYSHIWLRQIMRSLICGLVPKPLLQTDAPSICETNLTQKEGAIYLHIVTGCMNRQSDSAYSPVEQMIPIRDVSFKILAENINKVILVGAGSLPFERLDDGYIGFSVDLLEPYVLVKLSQ